MKNGVEINALQGHNEWYRVNVMSIIDEQVKILILDDDPFISKMLTSILTGYDVQCASSFQQFKELIEVFIPDIAIIDLVLPDAHGLNVCKWIRSQNRYEDVIMYILTSTDDEQTLIRAYSIGVMDYILKPFNKFILFSKLRRCSVLIEMKRKLERSVEFQKDIKQRLIQLNDFFNKCIKVDDVESIVALLSYVRYIIPIDGLFFFNKLRGGKYSVLKLLPHPESPAIIEKLHKVLKQDNNSVLFFFDRAHNVYAARLGFMHYGYVFFIKNTSYNPDERNLISLMAELFKAVVSKTEMYDYVEKQNKNYQNEISKIRQIQAAQLPKFKEIKGYEIASSFLPAEDISGDFFDAFHIGNDVFQIVLCDVSGHGIASAYIGNAIRTLVRIYSNNAERCSDVIYRVNQQMVKDGKGLYYYGTLVVCRLYPDGTVAYASGGHPPLCFYRKETNSIEEIINTGPLIGIFSDSTYDNRIITLERGDLLFLYTDGITETMHPHSKALYGEERLMESIQKFVGETPVELLHSVCGTMYEFSNYAQLQDDVTMICIKKN